MSRHQLYRNYDFENDLEEYDGEAAGDGEEEESPEDRELMRDATAAVRTVLGAEAGKVTDAQIQESLWHYYYDVDKSAAYLRKTFIDPPPDKKAKEDGSRACLYPLPPLPPPPPPSRAHAHVSMAAFFYDMPWLRVPPSRQAVFVPPPVHRGGLLGGASAPPKMSKLQALAAQRKRKAEAAKKPKEGGSGSGSGSGGGGDGGGSTAGDGPADAEAVRELRSKTARLAIGDPAAASPSTRAAADRAPPLEPVPMEGLQGPRGEPLPQPLEEQQQQQQQQQQPPPLAAAPSAFAQTLFGPRRPAVSATSALLAVPSLSRAPPSAFDAFLGPSPDDVVLEAQSKAFKKTAAGGANTPKKKGDKATAAALASGVKALKVDDTPLPRSKNLDVLGEYEKAKKKKSANFVVVGHVDAGKSTMMARLLLDLGHVEQRTIDKYRKEAETMGKGSFALAWVLDSGTDERAHGVTIDIATRHFETATTAFTILDAPGHRDFIPNMIAGASQADFAVLVVDASTGAFESGLKGQTREHALLLRSLGVARIVVAVNKLDTVDWSQARFDAIAQQVSGFLSATGFQLKNVSFVPVAGLPGDNLVRRATAPAAAWYTGRTLIEELETAEPLQRALDKPLHFPVSEAFKTAASAVSAAGRIEAGSLQVGDALLLVPAGEKAYVKALTRDGAPADWAVAGQNVVVHLAGIDPEHVRSGDVLCDPARPVACIDTFAMKALAFDMLFPMPLEVHRGRLNEPAVLKELTAILHKTTGKVTKKAPMVVRPGNVARLQVKLHSKVPLEPGQRVVLRAEGQTIAAGLLE